MSAGNDFVIDLRTQFPHLPRAPIVEAALHWQAAVGKPFDKLQLKAELERQFPGYECQIQQEIRAFIEGSDDGVEIRQRTQWGGLRLTGRGNSKGYVAQLKPNGVVLSRLAPYDCWENLRAQGLRFWDAYRDLAEPPIIERLGVRFINQVDLGAEGKSAEFLKDLPASPAGLGLSTDSFFYQDTFRVSGYPYQINWARTVQPTPNGEKVLILDIHVSTERIDCTVKEPLLKHLEEMRFLKNKLFFACITDQALKQFARPSHE